MERAHNLYKGKEGKWLGKMASMKRNLKRGNSHRSKDYIKDIVRNLKLATTPRKSTAELLSAYTSSICTETISSHSHYHMNMGDMTSIKPVIEDV